MTKDEVVEDEIELLRAIQDDTGMIRRYLRFLARGGISEALDKVATTSERQQMWRLADGTLSNEEIASQIGVTLRSVQYFVQEAESAGLFTSVKRGYPKRVEDMIPSEWKPWKPKKPQPEAETPP